VQHHPDESHLQKRKETPELHVANNPQIQRFEQKLVRDMRHIEKRPLSNQ
jgi:hypothetical protein